MAYDVNQRHSLEKSFLSTQRAVRISAGCCERNLRSLQGGCIDGGEERRYRTTGGITIDDDTFGNLGLRSPPLNEISLRFGS